VGAHAGAQRVGGGARRDDPGASVSRAREGARAHGAAGGQLGRPDPQRGPRAGARLDAALALLDERQRHGAVRSLLLEEQVVAAEAQHGEAKRRARARGPRRDRAGLAVAVAVAAGDQAQRADDLPRDGARDVARVGRGGDRRGAGDQRDEQHDGQVLDRPLTAAAAHPGTVAPRASRDNRAIVTRVRRISDDGTSARPRARGRRRGHARRR
jgi:hypothetical protein